jgi:hypothetical protein
MQPLLLCSLPNISGCLLLSAPIPLAPSDCRYASAPSWAYCAPPAAVRSAISCASKLAHCAASVAYCAWAASRSCGIVMPLRFQYGSSFSPK